MIRTKHTICVVTLDSCFLLCYTFKVNLVGHTFYTCFQSTHATFNFHFSLLSFFQIVQSVVKGLLEAGQPEEALDRAEDLFNQHGVRIDARTMRDLLDASLTKRDVYEARRVVVLIRRLFTPAERVAIRLRESPQSAIALLGGGAYKPMAFMDDMLLRERFQAFGLELT